MTYLGTRVRSLLLTAGGWLLTLFLVGGWGVPSAFAVTGSKGTVWYSDVGCKTPFKGPGTQTVGTIVLPPGGKVAYYCPADGADSADVIIQGPVAHAVWNGDVSTPPGSVTLNVYADCPSTANSTGCVDPFSDTNTSPYQIMDPGTPASCSVTLPPGRWRFHPSGSATNGRLEIRGN
ncbi:MAG TPA: hypothetical protein VMU14_24020 [Acidimicrobiales bacterium]|nr:hypothetical protein [Acidimicrobiales bacterium]